jgi:hypothetical protein
LPNEQLQPTSARIMAARGAKPSERAAAVERRRSSVAEGRIEEHAVIVHFDYAADSPDPLHDVEEQLDAAIAEAGVVEFDGNEIAVDLSEGSLYMYGANADALFAVVQPMLAAAEYLRNARATLRYWPREHGVREREAAL